MCHLARDRSSWFQNCISWNAILLVCWNTLISTMPEEAGCLLCQLPYSIWCQPLIPANSNLIDAALFSGLLASLFPSYLSAGLQVQEWLDNHIRFFFFSLLSSPSTHYFYLPKYQGSHLTFTTHT